MATATSTRRSSSPPMTGRQPLRFQANKARATTMSTNPTATVTENGVWLETSSALEGFIGKPRMYANDRERIPNPAEPEPREKPTPKMNKSDNSKAVDGIMKYRIMPYESLQHR